MNRIDFAIPQTGQVDLEIIDISGKKVCTLVDAEMEKGRHSVTWDRQGYHAGIYLVRLVAVGLLLVQKEIIMK